MKNASKIFLVVGCLLVLSAWIIGTANDINKADWLIGTWENNTPRGSIYESWIKSGELEFSGRSYIINEKDTVIFETILLVQELGGLYYIPTVKDQNDGLPVKFEAKVITETHLLFENAEHNFPQFISYTKIGADSLLAEIYGIRGGQERRVKFPMRRVR